MTNKRNKLTDSQIEMLTSLYAEGKSYSVIAEQFNVSMGTVANALRKAGVATRPRGRPKGSKNTTKSNVAIAAFERIVTTQDDDGIVSVSV